MKPKCLGNFVYCLPLFGIVRRLSSLSPGPNASGLDSVDRMYQSAVCCSSLLCLTHNKFRSLCPPQPQAYSACFLGGHVQNERTAGMMPDLPSFALNTWHFLDLCHPHETRLSLAGFFESILACCKVSMLIACCTRHDQQIKRRLLRCNDVAGASPCFFWRTLRMNIMNYVLSKNVQRNPL